MDLRADPGDEDRLPISADCADFEERVDGIDRNAITDWSRGMKARGAGDLASLSIRQLDPALKDRLRVRAA